MLRADVAFVLMARDKPATAQTAQGGTTYNINFSTLPTIRTTDRLICIWVPTGNPRMPLTCAWILDGPSQEDSVVDSDADEPDGTLYVFSMKCLEPSPNRLPSIIKIR
jgi:hypothetical protein